MENTKFFEIFKNIKESNKMINFAETDEQMTKFKDYQYFSFEVYSFVSNEKYIIYVQNDRYSYRGAEFTIYLKTGWNESKQISYPESLENIENMMETLEELAKIRIKIKKDVGAPAREITMDFRKYKPVTETIYKNIFERAELGFREKEILKNIDGFELLQNDGKYKIYKIYDILGNYFEINRNAKNGRYIVG